MTASAANVRLDGDGDLDITALKKGDTWTSGRIQTVREFTPPAGSEMMVTATIRQPDPASGQGYWPAFWMLGPGPSPESGEIDIITWLPESWVPLACQAAMNHAIATYWHAAPAQT